jgi:hypothetical protein
LCSVGFEEIYKSKNFDKSKAAFDVVELICDGAKPVPPLLEDAINSAVALARGE